MGVVRIIRKGAHIARKVAEKHPAIRPVSRRYEEVKEDWPKKKKKGVK